MDDFYRFHRETVVAKEVKSEDRMKYFEKIART